MKEMAEGGDLAEMLAKAQSTPKTGSLEDRYDKII